MLVGVAAEKTYIAPFFIHSSLFISQWF